MSYQTNISIKSVDLVVRSHVTDMMHKAFNLICKKSLPSDDEMKEILSDGLLCDVENYIKEYYSFSGDVNVLITEDDVISLYRFLYE